MHAFVRTRVHQAVMRGFESEDQSGGRRASRCADSVGDTRARKHARKHAHTHTHTVLRASGCLDHLKLWNNRCLPLWAYDSNHRC